MTRGGAGISEKDEKSGEVATHPRYPTYWSWPEWRTMKEQWGLFEVRFDQGPMGHARRKPTRLGTNMPKLPRVRRLARTRTRGRRKSGRLHPGTDCPVKIMGILGARVEGSTGDSGEGRPGRWTPSCQENGSGPVEAASPQWASAIQQRMQGLRGCCLEKQGSPTHSTPRCVYSVDRHSWTVRVGGGSTGKRALLVGGRLPGSG